MATRRNTASWPLPPEAPRPTSPGTPVEPTPPRPSGPRLPTWEEPDPHAGRGDLAEQLLAQRLVIASGHLDDPLAHRVTSQLLLLDRRHGDPVELHLACPTSELGASLALADAVDLLAAPVHVVIRGSLGGPAVAVLCAARTRAAHEHAVIVLSVPRVLAEGDTEQLRLLVEQYELLVHQLEDRVVRRTGHPAPEVEADLARGRVLSAEQAREYGLLDELL